MSKYINSFKHLITSVSGSLEDPELLARDTSFSASEIETLHDFLKKINNVVNFYGRKSSINKQEFRQALFQTTTNEYYFLDRVFDLFDRQHNGMLEFKEFTRVLSVFHPNTPIEDKIDLKFQLCDLKHKGFIEPQEVKRLVLTTRVEHGVEYGKNLLGDHIIRSMIRSDGKQQVTMHKEEWRNLVYRHPILLKDMTIEYLKDIANPTNVPTSIDLGSIQPC